MELNEFVNEFVMVFDFDSKTLSNEVPKVIVSSEFNSSNAFPANFNITHFTDLSNIKKLHI